LAQKVHKFTDENLTKGVRTIATSAALKILTDNWDTFVHIFPHLATNSDAELFPNPESVDELRLTEQQISNVLDACYSLKSLLTAKPVHKGVATVKVSPPKSLDVKLDVFTVALSGHFVNVLKLAAVISKHSASWLAATTEVDYVTKLHNARKDVSVTPLLYFDYIYYI